MTDATPQERTALEAYVAPAAESAPPLSPLFMAGLDRLAANHHVQCVVGAAGLWLAARANDRAEESLGARIGRCFARP